MQLPTLIVHLLTFKNPLNNVLPQETAARGSISLFMGEK